MEEQSDRSRNRMKELFRSSDASSLSPVLSSAKSPPPLPLPHPLSLQESQVDSFPSTEKTKKEKKRRKASKSRSDADFDSESGLRYYLSRSPMSQTSLQETLFNSKLIRESVRIVEKALARDTKDSVILSRQEALVCHRALMTLLDPQVDEMKQRIHALPEDVRQYIMHEFADFPAFRRLESAHSMRSIASSTGGTSVKSFKSSPSWSMNRKSSFPSSSSRSQASSLGKRLDILHGERARAFSSNDMDFLDNSMLIDKVFVSDESEDEDDEEDVVEDQVHQTLTEGNEEEVLQQGSEQQGKHTETDALEVRENDGEVSEESKANFSVFTMEPNTSDLYSTRDDLTDVSTEGDPEEQRDVVLDNISGPDSQAPQHQPEKKESAPQSVTFASQKEEGAGDVAASEGEEPGEEDDFNASECSSVSSSKGRRTPLLHKRSGSLSPISFFQLDKTISMLVNERGNESGGDEDASNLSSISPLQKALREEASNWEFGRQAASEEASGGDLYFEDVAVEVEEEEGGEEKPDEFAHDVSSLESKQGAENEMLRLLRQVDEWDSFDIFRVAELASCGPVVLVGFAVFERHGIFETLKVPIKETRAFFYALQKRYLDNPYHNAIHAADVGQTMSHMFIRCGLNKYATDLTRFAALFAAFSHDVGHPGVTNAFLVQTWHPLAVRYNDKSPLEMMHASIAFELIRNEGLDVLVSLTSDEKLVFRKTVISMILATDNAEHDTLLGRLLKVSQALITSNSNLVSDLDQMNILEAALHAADISSSCKRWTLYQQWTARLCTEFRNQGDLEKERGLPVLPFMDKSIKLPISRFQSGFIRAIVEPLYEALDNVADLHFEHCLSRLRANLDHWKDIQEDEEKQTSFLGVAVRTRAVKKAKNVFLSKRSGST